MLDLVGGPEDGWTYDAPEMPLDMPNGVCNRCVATYLFGKELDRSSPQMVFDWEKAARIIKERQPVEAGAGLSGDWEWTGGLIWRDGKPVAKDDTYVYLSSNWAFPGLEIDAERIDCWRYEEETPGWNSDTYWPPEALSILGIDEDAD